MTLHLSPEEHKAYRAKYLKDYAASNRPSRRDINKSYYQRNKDKVVSSMHNTYVKRNYPDSVVGSDITNNSLMEWVKVHREQPCPYCGEDANHIDHRVPLSKGGRHCFANIQFICKNCNMGKSNLLEQEFLDWAKRVSERAGEVSRIERD